nr:MAG TPA: hypothetical protein [Caudoviricetes sp.]
MIIIYGQVLVIFMQLLENLIMYKKNHVTIQPVY